MTATEKVLLDALLDALDRLYDRECGVAGTHALLVASAIALGGHPLVSEISAASAELEKILPSGASRDGQNEAALGATDALRCRLAELGE